MRRNRARAGELTDDCELDHHRNNNPRTEVTNPPEGASDKVYHDQIDQHSQEEHQQVGLLADELAEGKGDEKGISTRLSVFVPNILVKSHFQKSFDSNSVPTVSDNTSARAMRKMLRDGDRAENRLSGSRADLESNEKTSTRSSFTKIVYYLLALMAFGAVALLLVFLLQSPKVLDNNDRCAHHKLKLKQENYKLFATKTLYNTALDCFPNAQSPTTLPSSASSNGQHLHTHNHGHCDRKSITLSKIFHPTDTLETIHNRLTNDSCRIIQFNLFSRHAARTPDNDDIEKLNKIMTDIQLRIQSSRPVVSESVQGSAMTPDTSNKSQPVNDSKPPCEDPLTKLMTWENPLPKKHGNMVTMAGFHETEELALRFKNLYPELFDGQKANIRFGVTDELRTTQTAISFLKQMTNVQTGCQPSEYPNAELMDQQQPDDLNNNRCVAEFATRYHDDRLKFHKKCKSIGASTRDITPAGVNLTKSERTMFIAESVSDLLGLEGEKRLTPEEVRAIYEMCRYESAQRGETSIWCHVFEHTDLQFYEYVTDALDYLNEMYGNAAFATSACEVTKDLVESIKKTLKSTAVDQKPEANFYFTHSSAIQRMIAASVHLENDPAYHIDTILQNLKSHTVPKDRQWRTSLFSPFSANLAFSTYKCEGSQVTMNTPTGVDLSFQASPFKVVASLNEQPILLDGCSDFVCPVQTIQLSSKLGRLSYNCDLNSVCKVNYNVT